MKNKKRTSLGVIKKFFIPAFAYPKESLKAIFQAVSLGIITVYLVYLLKDITNLFKEGRIEDFKVLITLFIILVFLYLVILVISRNWSHSILWPVYRKFMYRTYISKYIILDNNETEKLGTGSLIAMIDKGMYSWVDLLNRFYIDVLPSIILILSSFFLIGTINLLYFVVILVFFTLILLITYFLQKKAKKYRLERKNKNISLTRRFVRILMSKYEILQNNKIKIEGDYMVSNLNINIHLNKKIGNLGIYTDVFLKLLIDGSKILIVIMFGFGLLGKQINFGEFISLMSIIYILDQALSKSLGIYIDFTKIFVDVEKLWDFFDKIPIIKGYYEGNNFKYKLGKIEIKNLRYGYGESKEIFKKFNLQIKGGKITAIIGNSGSGKSTLIKLISGYIKPNSGEIIIDNQKLSKTSLKSYYKHIGYLTQEPSIFDGSIFDNLTYAIDREVNKGELHKVIINSKCEFIYDLPNGLETEIGERGVRLSGGQKQRLAIAKIFLKNPKIIFLDEPTSALDSFSEELITKSMHNLFIGRTIIIIAHRLQTVKDAHEIILINNGKITERGTHLSLIKKNGQYKKMIDLQSGF